MLSEGTERGDKHKLKRSEKYQIQLSKMKPVKKKMWRKRRKECK
jgi:hypothetical protein